MYPFMIPNRPEGIPPLPMALEHAPPPKESPGNIAPKPRKQCSSPEVNTPGASTHNLLCPDEDDDDNVSTFSAASDAHSLESLTEVEPRTFMDIVDDTIPVRTEYRRPETPHRNGIQDSSHGLPFGAEVLPGRVVKRRHSYSAVPRSFAADEARHMPTDPSGPYNIFEEYAQDISLEEQLGHRRPYGVQQRADKLSEEGAFENKPSREAQGDKNRRKHAEIEVLTAEEMWPGISKTSEDGAGREKDDAATGRPKTGSFSKFKKIFKSHGNDFIWTSHGKGEQGFKGNTEDPRRQVTGNKKNPRTGLNMLAHTMGFGMGRS
ncbi:hypothetical protein PMIN06_005051 [Paraphaeosphaeria minitans]|uniref:Uncharacterized protein n=1 Tax=Paraphaeosphaeria minitans TaxID=565426 RepID=A0A9P6G8H2_9PLEO|nr:hypothetical protein PMIN01_10800 [Paraphaeosphaeria minitans]